MKYSLGSRKKVLDIRQKEGLSIRGVAKQFGIASRLYPVGYHYERAERLGCSRTPRLYFKT